MKVQAITVDNFKRKFSVKELDPWTSGVFTNEDIKTLKNQSGIVGIDRKLIELTRLIPVFLRDPIRIFKNLKELIKVYGLTVFRFYTEKEKQVKDTFPFSDYTLKASIIAAFKPKRLFEIGTSSGWGIVSFRSVLHDCQCYTMEFSKEHKTGFVIRQKKQLKIKQIWADSLTYNYSLLKPIDVSYIDGNHAYKWVFSDLINCNKITTKMIMLDDYIPGKNVQRDPTIQWADYFLEIVAAVHDFLKIYSEDFLYAYWIKNTRICVLIKK